MSVGDDERTQCVYVRGHSKRARLGESGRSLVFHRAPIPAYGGLPLCG